MASLAAGHPMMGVIKTDMVVINCRNHHSTVSVTMVLIVYQEEVVVQFYSV